MILASVGGLTSCGVVSPDKVTVCTLIGCVSGLTVHLSSRPAGTYRVEVFAESPGQQPAYMYECTVVANCAQDILFQDLIADRPIVRVTTTTGSRTTELPQVNYTVTYPNGERCGPTCRHATVTVEVP